MKTLAQVLVLFIFILSSCSGSDTYQGNWKATDADGGRFEISFSPNSLSIKDSTGQPSSFKYKQNRVSIENGVETYGITIEDGRAFSIHFPIANDESKGVIMDGAGNAVYVISRTDYISYEDIYSL